MAETAEKRMLRHVLAHPENAGKRVEHALASLKTAKWADMSDHPWAGQFIKKSQGPCKCGRDCGLSIGLEALTLQLRIKRKLVNASCYEEITGKKPTYRCQ